MKNDTCGCCEGLHRLTPLATRNRPGLNALTYRVGTYATFLETMKARLSSLYLDIARDEFDAQGRPLTDRVYPLQRLTTRAGNDPAIALLDSWAILGAVLTFYQERIANEGYLNTAIERRSILELANLIGYEPRPGVSASVFLAYTIDPNFKEPVIISAGARSQSIPDPGEGAETFETSDPLEARAAYNNLKPRRTRPQTKDTITRSKNETRLYLQGTTTNLKPNDPLLIDFGDGSEPRLYRVLAVAPDTALDRTLASLADWRSPETPADGNFTANVLSLAQRLQDTSVIKGTTAKAEMVGRVVELLKTLERQAKSAADEVDLADFLNNATLPRLQEELAVAESDVKYARVKTWLAPLIKELNTVVDHGSTRRAGAVSIDGKAVDPIVGVLGKLTMPASVPPRNTLHLKRDLKTSFAARADLGAQLITTFQPGLGKTLATALSSGRFTPGNTVRVYALRIKAAPFGNISPPKVTSIDAANPLVIGEWDIADLKTAGEQENVINLDGGYDKILPQSWVAIDMAAVDGSRLSGVKKVKGLIIAQAQNPNAQLARLAYGISGKTTSIQLADVSGKEQHWFEYNDIILASATTANDFQIIRRTAVYAQSEELALAEQPIEEDLCGGTDNWIELDGWYADLKSGRLLIISGERTDITVPDPDQPGHSIPVPGVTASELVMLAEVIQDIATEDGPASQQTKPDILPGEKTHTFVKLAKGLKYCYRRETVTIYGNVVKATHGETRKEVLGSGDGSQILQSFRILQSPLTFVAAPNPSGVDSTLAVYINDVQWHGVDSLAGLGPTDRKYITRTDDNAKTTVIFGNGEHGARLPTGLENVRSSYRSGIGKGGNVKARQISLLTTRPLGVKSVVNPLGASGGADRENRDQARKNAPLAVTALDRLVSVQDYADFTRTFAGIGKATATNLAVQNRELVHVTIAGADDIPIEITSDLYRNLLLAIRGNGDPYQPFQVDLRELLLLVVSAGVRIWPDYIWDKVATQMRATLLETFSFEKRDLGRDVFLSEVIGTMQAVPGVAFVDVDLLAAIPEKKADKGIRRLLTPDEITRSISDLLDKRFDEQGLPDVQKTQPPTRIPAGLAVIDNGTVQPARLAIFAANVPDTLILNRI